MDLIIILGKGGVGKSTFAKQISEYVISLDEIIRPWHDPNSSDDDYVFNVYRPGGNDFIRKMKARLVEEVRGKFRTGAVVVEGAIEDKKLIEDIIYGCAYKIIYLRPASKDLFLRSMLDRIDQEYQIGERRLGRVWDKLSVAELADYKKNGRNGALYARFMTALADEKYATIDSTLPLLTGLKYRVVSINW